MDRLFILASPKKKNKQEEEKKSSDADNTTPSTPSTPKRRVVSEEDIAKAFQSTKMSNVQKQESQWVEEMGKLLETAAAASGGADDSGGGGGMLKAVIDTVIGNLQLSITNIHIRYEDSTTNPDHPFACGLTLHSLAAHTVDELGQKAFVTNNPLDILRKATKLSRIAVYYDVDNEGSAAWVPPVSSWRKLPPVEWDAWFLPGVDSSSSSSPTSFKGRTYVLEPVDGRALYTRMGKAVKHSEEEPVTEVELSLDVVAVKLTDSQYQSYQKLLSEVSLYTARRPHQGYRPTVRPSVAPKLWWRYAMHAVLNKSRRTLTWQQSVRYAQMRSTYINLYVQHLTSGGGYSEIRNMDAVLRECTIVMFRRMAHKQVQRERKKAAIEQKRQGAMQQQQQQQQQDQGWIAWLTGTTGTPGTGTAAPLTSTTTSTGADLNAERAELNAEEYSKLVELVEEQKQGIVSTTDHTPFTLLTKVKARIGSATASLISTSTTTTVLLQGGLEGIHLTTEYFPETLKVNLEVTAMGIDGPDGVFLKTGATIDKNSTSIDQPLRALSVNVIKSPQDGRADVIVDGELTPSYVYYSSSTVQKVADFFHASPAEGTDFDFSSLSATATTQLEKARRLAAAYAASALRSRPHLKLKLALHAPKIAIPIEDGHGRAALALDLGYFVIQTDEEMPARLNKEEAALYECLKMSGRDVSAYLVDGPFDWTQHQEARREGEAGGEGSSSTTTTTSTSSSSKGIPLLGECGMRVKLQVARFADPAQPLLKLQPSIPILHFHISPGRIQRLLRVLKGAFPPPPPPPASTTTSLPAPSGVDTTTGVLDGSTAWKLHIDLEGAVQVLTWTGLGRSSAVWSSRHAYIYQGRLLLYDSDNRLSDDRPLWSDGLKIMQLSNNITTESSKRVVALAGEHVKMEELGKEMTYSRNPPLLLRLPNEEEAGVWYRKLLVSQQSFRQEILDDGTTTASTTATDDTSSIMSSSSMSSLDRQTSLPPYMTMSPDTATTTEDVHRKKRLVQIEAQMGEVALYACGRAPSDWWPPSENDDDGKSGGGTATTATTLNEENEVVNVDKEVSLILLRASGGALSFEYSDIGMTFKTALGALEIEDLLVGPRCQEHRYLLQSVDDDNDVLEVDEDLFYDPQGSTGTISGTCPSLTPTVPVPNDDDDWDMVLSPRVSAYMSRALSTCRLLSTEEHEEEENDADEDTLRPSHSRRIKQEAGRRGVALISFKLRQPGTPEYEDCDAQMEVSLDSIYFYCNRPTLAALISFGLDIYGSYLTVFPPPLLDAAEQEQQEGEDGEVVESAEGFGIQSRTGDDDGTLSSTTNTPSFPAAAAAIMERRRVFSLRLSLGSLHAMLNYEGSQCTTLGRACVQDFDFLLDVHPDTSYHIKSSLGNIQAFNGSLEEGHPYHQICGLRPGSATSLVSFQFDQCLASSSSSSSSGPTGYGRVPSGQGHYTLKVCLSELQVVFLYRFVQEVMQYIEVFLAMRLPSLHQAGDADADRASGGITVATTTTATTEASPQSAATLEPFVLLLEVEMNAPVIKMPKHSHSMDSIEYDLGTLHLHNTIFKNSNNNDVLIDQSDLTFSGMECVFINGGQRGKNVITNDVDGWKLQWQRPLIREQRGSALPAFDLSVNIPQITARLSDLEYMSLISVAVTNTSEEVVLPKGAQWVQQHHITPIVITNDSGSDTEGEVELDHWATATDTMRASGSMALAFSPSSKLTATRPPPPPATTTKTSNLPFVCVSIDMAGAELEVHRHIAGLPDAQPLARFLIANLNVNFANDESGTMKVSLCLPKVEARDLRPEIPPEQSLVISSGSKASFLMLDWSATPGMVKQSLSVNLQKPLFVAELSFLLALTKFVYPGLSVGTTNAVPYITGDILLQGDTGTSIHGVNRATEDLWLSPSVRLLADRPGASSFTYDGQGRCIILPSKAHLGEQLPLIIIGGGKQLRLKNVTIVHSSALPACLQLGPGARMHAEPSDGVVMVDHHHHHHHHHHHNDGEESGTGKDIGHLGLHELSLHDDGEGWGASPAPLSPTMKAAAALKALSPISTDLPPVSATNTLDLVVRSVGMGLQVMHYEYGKRSNSKERVTGRGKEQPRNKTSSSSSSSIKFIELISAKMDLEASYHSEQEEAMSRHQHGSIELQGLRVETRIISDPLGQYTEHEQHKKNKGKKHRTVLKPCKISFKYDMLSFSEYDDGCGNGHNDNQEEDSIDLGLTTTSLRLNISPDTLAMMITMTDSAIQPLLQPPPTTPIIHCNQFERIWCFDPASFIQQEQRVALSVSVTGAGAEGGITAWRAKAPVGYCPVGDVITAGTSQPSFEVLAVALNSGIAAYPTGYTMIWSQGGTGTDSSGTVGRAVIWRPIPPPDFMALGDVVTILMGGGESSSPSPTAAATGRFLPSPPGLDRVVCVRSDVLVECSVGECLKLPPLMVRPGSATTTRQLYRSMPPVELWTLDNAVGTFWACPCVEEKEGDGDVNTRDQHQQEDAVIRAFDLRSPLGVTPAALLEGGIAEYETITDKLGSSSGTIGQEERQGGGGGRQMDPASQLESTTKAKLKLIKQPKQLYQIFQQIRRERTITATQATVLTTVYDFQRIWTEFGRATNGEGLTVWRPVVPPGFCSLGDCLVRGIEPPPGVVAIKERPHGHRQFSSSAAVGSSSEATLPLCSPPRAYELVWTDHTSLEGSRLNVWRPIAFPGYVSVGYVATVGGKPSNNVVRCVRADVAVPARLNAPLMYTRSERRMFPPMTAWTTDDKLKTFVVVASDKSGTLPPQESWRLKPNFHLLEHDVVGGGSGGGGGELTTGASTTTSTSTRTTAAGSSSFKHRRKTPSPSSPGGVNIVVRTGPSSLLIFGAQQIPLLQLDFGSIAAGIHGPSRNVVQAYVGLRMGISAYNNTIRHWEPAVEPWDVIFKCDANRGDLPRNGIDPGVHATIKASGEVVYATLAAGAAASLLDSLEDWKAVLANSDNRNDNYGGLLPSSRASDGTSVPTVIINTLGTDAAMELDYGDHIDVVTIPAGKEVKLLKPIPQHPLHYDKNNIDQRLSPSSSLPGSRPSVEMRSRDALPYDLVLLDIDDVTLHTSTSGRSSSNNKKRRVYCSAAIVDKGTTSSSSTATATTNITVRTRTVECETYTGKGDIHERLVLPISLTSNDTTDEIVEVVVQVWDATTVDINQPRCLGSTILRISKRHSMTEQQPFVEKVDNNGDIVQLQGSYQVQRQWNQEHSSISAAAAQVQMNAAGCRALSLQDQYEGQWVNIPSAGHQHESSSSSITALRIGSHGIAVEESTSLASSTSLNREVLRSLCQVVNSTDFYLEVCLIEVDTASVENSTTSSSSFKEGAEGEEEWDTMVSDPHHQHEEMVVVLENERWLAQRGWSPINLTPTDPGRFLEQQTGEVFELFPDLDHLPSGWDWDGGWYLDRSHHPHHTGVVGGGGKSADKEGWRYGADWGSLDRSSSSSGSGDVVVRQRRWLRKKRAVHPDAAALPHVIGCRGKTNIGRSTIVAPETSVLKRRTVVGVAAPGQLLPLPLEWQKSGVQLQVRPCIGKVSSKTSKGTSASTFTFTSTSTSSSKTSSHDWSLGVSNTDMNSLQLELLDESITALLMCAPLNIEEEEEDTDKTATTHSDDQSVLAACTLWFSLSIEADSISPATGNASGFTKGRGSTTGRRASTSMMMGSGTGEQLTDWKIVIQPPIILQNRLPIPGSLMVWEQQPGGRNLVDRQASEVGIGGTVAVHTADVRQPISFTFYPEGYDWAEPSPATLARGGISVKRGSTVLGGTTRSYSMALPDRFRLTRPGSNIPVEVFIQRDFTFGPWLMGVTQELDPGSVLARGIPMHVALLAPLWIVNATHLVIDAVVVPIQDTAGTSSGTVDGGYVTTSSGVGHVEDVHVVRTGDLGIDSGGMFLAGERLKGRSVAPSSLEIMSYPVPHLLAVTPSSSSLDPSSHSSNGGAASARASFSQQQQQNQQKQHQQKMKRYGVRVRIAGSSWTPPMLLDATNLSSSGGGEESLQVTEPVLIQAVVKSEGLIHEVLARIQLDTTVGGGGCQVLRLEPHVVLSNRTSVPLQLMLCRSSVGGIPLSAAVGGGGGGMGGGGMSAATLKRKTSFMGGTSKPVLQPSSPLTGSLMPENGMSFTQMVGHIAGEVVGDGNKANNKDTSTLGESSVVRPSIRSLSSSRNLETSHWDESSWGLQLGQIASARSSKAMSLTKWDRTPSMSHHPSVPLVALPPDIEHQSAAAGMVFELPAGVCAVPLHLVTAASEQYTLCFRCGTADVDGTPLWSRPVVINKLTEEEEYLMLPVEYHRENNGSSPTSPTGSEAQGAVAMMRMSVLSRGLSAGLHIVLSTVHSDPPYLVENRTSIPLMYRQAHVSGAPFHPLPPWTAAGWVWQYTVQGVPLEVQVAEDGNTGGGLSTSTTVIISSKYQTFSLSGVDGLPPPSSSISSSSSFLEGEDADLVSNSQQQQQQQQGQLMLTSAPYQCTVHVGYWEQSVMGREGLLGIGVDGGIGSLAQLGRGGLDRVMSIAPGKDPLFDAEAILQAKTNRLTANQPMTVVFELGTLEISIIDFKPMEVATITLTGVNLTVSSGISSTGNTYRLVRGSLQRLQLDDQMPGTKFPVVLAAVVDRQQQQEQSSSTVGGTAMANVPLLSGTIISQAAPGHRGTTFYPAVVVRWPQTVQIAVSERLVWKLVDIYSRLDSHMGGRFNNAVDQSSSAVVDVPVRIRLLTVGALRCRVSFQGDPLSRPRTISGGVWATVMDMANFHAAPVAIRGLDVSDISMLKAAFIDYVYQVIKSQAFGVTLSLVRNFGVVGGASRVLGVLSAGVAKWAAGKKSMGGVEGERGGGGEQGDDDPSTSSPSAAAGQRNITDVGDGILEGASAIGKGFMKGMKGLVSKPVQGAKQGGMEGAFKGLAKGMMGAVANPVSGALDALSAAAEGFDAQFGSKDKKIEGLVVNRHRLARVVGTDGRIQPIMREDGGGIGGGGGGGGGESTQATWIESIGQALLRNTLLLEYSTQLAKGSGGKGTSGGPGGALGAATSEGYEEHFVCPNHRVLLLTNRSIMLVTAPGFAELDGAAEVGQLGPFSLSDVDPGDVEWRVRWTDVLAFELRWSARGAKNPDKLVVHRRGRPGFVELESLARVISCYPNTPQASQVKLVAQNIMNKWVAPAVSYTTTATSTNSSRKKSMVFSRNKDDADDGLPMTMPCVDFKLSWHTNPNRSPVVSFWKPIPPDGYSAVGDVVSLGLEPPPTPLPCFKLSSSHNNSKEVNTTTTSSPHPATAPPVDFTLIWRFNGSSRAVTMWMPVPPPGYVALGGVALPGPQIPSVEEYVCLRADLAGLAKVFDSPIWQYDPTIMLSALQQQQQQIQQDGIYQPEMWKVSVWQVDNKLGTFLVTRSLLPPPPEVVKTMRDY